MRYLFNLAPTWTVNEGVNTWQVLIRAGAHPFQYAIPFTKLPQRLLDVSRNAGRTNMARRHSISLARAATGLLSTISYSSTNRRIAVPTGLQ
jgi:hypothetical protein